MEELFRQFWWLIFPLFGLVYGFVHLLQQNRTQDRAFELLRIYAEQGKEPPPEVLKALSQVSAPEAQWRGSSDPRGPAATAWWTFFIFAALTAGFATGIGVFNEEARGAFLVVTVVMAVLAAGTLFMAIYATFRKRP